MIERISPQQYFMVEENQFREGLKWGATLIIIGIIIGTLVVYLARR